MLFRETYIRVDYKQRKACSETFFRTVFFENIKIESNSTFLKYYVLSLLMVIKMKRLYFRFNFWKKNKENIALLENKKFGKSYFKPSEQTCIYFFSRRPTMVGGIKRHSISNFCPGFLINQVRTSVISGVIISGDVAGVC